MSTEGVAKLWDPDSEAEPKILRGHSYHVYGVSYSPDGKQLATASLDRQVILWDVESGAVLKRLRGHEGWVVGVASTPAARSSPPPAMMPQFASGTLRMDASWPPFVATRHRFR